MLSSHKKVLMILIIALSALGCKFVVWGYLNATTLSSRRECNRMGGEWVIDRENLTGWCEFPELEEDEKPDNYGPREEDSGLTLNDKSDELPEEDHSTSTQGNAEACIASLDLYEIQVSEPEYYQNDDFDGCESKMIIRNLSGNLISYNVYKLSTLHPEEDGWHRWDLDPSITDTHEHRLWSETHEGETIVQTIGQIVISATTDECSTYLDKDNQANWEKHIVTIDDPCKP